MTKAEFKWLAQYVLKNEYGFTAPLKDIVLLEGDGNGNYVLFEVNGHEYRYYNGVVEKRS